MTDSESSSSGGSDAEELARCREAATPAWGLEQRPQGAEKPEAGAADKPAPAPQPSRRREVSQHEEDGNELRTTPEFRAHVAKKLGALLDSSIAIAEVWKKSQKVLQQAAKEGDGFRLFFTSVPGGHEKEASPKPCRKRQPPSSSEDSDEERQRCREAAVSAADILQASAMHCPAKGEGQAEKKKKLKKKAKKRAGAGLDQVKEAGSISGDPVSLGTQKKKKKKKAKKAREPSLCPPAECAAAKPEN